MALKISGMNNIINKLDNLSNIKAEEIVKEAAKALEDEIKDRAKFSDDEKNYIGTFEARKAGNSVYIDVGLKNDEVPFELWKGLWFHNWGYWNKGWNFGENGPYVHTHVLWFNDAINKVGKSVKSDLKSKIKREYSKALK